jgi:DnaD/phage-associated family protein
MKGFSGFPAGKQSYTPMPALFFSELLPQIDHLGELKVTLHIFWLLSRKTGERRCVSGEELANDPVLLAGLASSASLEHWATEPSVLGQAGSNQAEPSDQALTMARANRSQPTTQPLNRPKVKRADQAMSDLLSDALERAVVRGTFLRVWRGEGTGRSDWYFANSAQGRKAVEDLVAGRWTLPMAAQRPGEAEDHPVSLQVQTHRPNIFALYEQNIGPLTPLLANELLEAEDTYPASWIEDAFREAVELNKRSWRYIRRILERWAAEGKNGRIPRQQPDQDRRRFIEGEYADYIEH